MAPIEAITEAGRLIANPAHWCQGALARTRSGIPVAPTSTRAKAWDSIGVIYKVARCRLSDPDSMSINTVGPVLFALEMAAGRLYRRGIVTVNDEMGHEAVMECMRLAYRRLKE